MKSLIHEILVSLQPTNYWYLDTQEYLLLVQIANAIPRKKISMEFLFFIPSSLENMETNIKYFCQTLDWIISIWGL